MALRDAEIDDTVELTDLIESYYDEAGFKAPPVNREKTQFVLNHVIANLGDEVFFKVIEIEGVIVGAMYAERVTDLWSDAEKVVEQFLYIRPEFRGRPSAGKLMLAFAKWAQLRPAVVRVEASMGIDNEHAAGIFAKLGYEPRGSLHGMEAY